MTAAVAAVLACGLPGCGPGSAATAPAGSPSPGFRVIRTYPHDPGAFTEGLAMAGGYVYESTGYYHEPSTLREVDLATGRVMRQVSIPPEYFAEGLAASADRLVELTWRSQQAFVFDRVSLRHTATLGYAGEGWGLAVAGDSLVMSNGSAQLAFRDPLTFAVRRVITVTDRGHPVPLLNELEFVRGEILANVFKSDDILRIDPASGAVRGRINLRSLHPAIADPEAVLNGIAYDPAADRLLVTGKLWPVMYEIRLPG